MWGRGARGSKKYIPEETPLHTFPALSSPALGAAQPQPWGQARQGKDKWGLGWGNLGLQGCYWFVWRGLNQKQLNGEKAEAPDILTNPKEIAMPVSASVGSSCSGITARAEGTGPVWPQNLAPDAEVGRWRGLDSVGEWWALIVQIQNTA